MMRMIVFALVILLRVAASEKVRYDNHRVYRITTDTKNERDLIKALIDTNEYKVWREGSHNQDIIVAPHKLSHIADFVKENNLTAEVLINNIQKLFDDQEVSAVNRDKATGIDWTAYYNLKNIYDWLDELAAGYSSVEVVSAGKSYEGRDIKGIRITNGDKLPGVIFESGIHAREWIAPAATSWIVNEILKSSAGSIWRQYNYVYFPVTNPDGYEYTHTTDRTWRKTRTPYPVYFFFTCYGADPNRNWDFKWEKGGSSKNPCCETYAGPKAFSEIEVLNLANYFTNISRDFDIYISFHSFSQLLMYPWGYTAEKAPLANTWKRIGDAAAADLKAVHGTNFTVGDIYDTVYEASGSSIEWYYAKFNSTFAYVFELRDTGEYGFALPADQIIPSAEELMAALKRFLVEYTKLDVTKASQSIN